MIVARSVIWWGYIALSQPIWWLGAVAIWAVTAPIDPRRRLLHAYTCVWGAQYLHLCPWWRLRIEGRENYPCDTACVVTPNHQSLGDVLALFGMHRPFKWVSKQSVFRLPFLGWNMRMNDYVPLVRGEKDSIGRMMAHCQRHLDRGSPVLMFPEGTRSKDGRMRPFKHGAFTLAVSNDVPVVPVIIEGTMDALPKEGFLFKNSVDIVVRILPAIHPREVGGDRDALMTLVRQVMADELARMRRVAPDEVVQRAA